MIAWDESGAGLPLLLVHGITEDRHVWDRVLPLLADDFRCVRLDLRGHGESPAADDLSAFAMADDVAEVVEAAQIDEPPVVVGHSLGGVVSTIYASRAPTRSVVNVDQPLRLGDFARALEPLAEQLRGAEWRAALEVVFASLGIENLGDVDRAYVRDKIDEVPHEVVLGVWGIVLDTPAEELDALAESLLSTVDTPYLALHGGQPGEAYREWLATHLLGATFEVWDGVGHFIQLVEPQRLATRIKEFVST